MRVGQTQKRDAEPWDGETIFSLRMDEGTVRELTEGRVTDELQAIAREALQTQEQWTLRYEKTVDAPTGDAETGSRTGILPGSPEAPASDTPDPGAVSGVRA